MEEYNRRLNLIIYIIAAVFWLIFIMGGNFTNIPLVIMTVLIVIVVFIFLFRNYGLANNRDERTQRRRTALKTAKLYLAPYRDIWKNLKLSNKYCALYLRRDGRSKEAKEYKSMYGGKCQYRSFRIINSEVHTYEDLWNKFCNCLCFE